MLSGHMLLLLHLLPAYVLTASAYSKICPKICSAGIPRLYQEYRYTVHSYISNYAVHTAASPINYKLHHAYAAPGYFYFPAPSPFIRLPFRRACTQKQDASCWPAAHSMPPSISWSATNLTICSSAKRFCCWYAYSRVFSQTRLIILGMPVEILYTSSSAPLVNRSCFTPAYARCAAIYFPVSARSSLPRTMSCQSSGYGCISLQPQLLLPQLRLSNKHQRHRAAGIKFIIQQEAQLLQHVLP